MQFALAQFVYISWHKSSNYTLPVALYTHCNMALLDVYPASSVLTLTLVRALFSAQLCKASSTSVRTSNTITHNGPHV